MSIFESMPETPDLGGPLMEAFKTMAQMNLFEDQPGMQLGLKIFIGVMIILLIVGVSMLSYWWATNQKNLDKNNKPLKAQRQLLCHKILHRYCPKYSLVPKERHVRKEGNGSTLWLSNGPKESHDYTLVKNIVPKESHDCSFSLT